LSVCLFSLLFTSIFYTVHRNYWHYFDSILKEVVKIEERANADSGSTGPWTSYNEAVAARRMKRIWRTVLVYGPLALFLVAACAMIAGNIVSIRAAP
jgi:hypothetical protein